MNPISEKILNSLLNILIINGKLRNMQTLGVKTLTADKESFYG